MTNVSPCCQWNGFPLMIGGAATAERMINTRVGHLRESRRVPPHGRRPSSQSNHDTWYRLPRSGYRSCITDSISRPRPRQRAGDAVGRTQSRGCSRFLSARRIGTAGRGSCRRRSSSSGHSGCLSARRNWLGPRRSRGMLCSSMPIRPANPPVEPTIRLAVVLFRIAAQHCVNRWRIANQNGRMCLWVTTLSGTMKRQKRISAGMAFHSQRSHGFRRSVVNEHARSRPFRGRTAVHRARHVGPLSLAHRFLYREATANANYQCSPGNST